MPCIHVCTCRAKRPPPTGHRQLLRQHAAGWPWLYQAHTLAHRAAPLARPPARPPQLEERFAWMRTRELSQVLWAAAKLRFVLPMDLQERLLGEPGTHTRTLHPHPCPHPHLGGCTSAAVAGRKGMRVNGTQRLVSPFGLHGPPSGVCP